MQTIVDLYSEHLKTENQLFVTETDFSFERSACGIGYGPTGDVCEFAVGTMNYDLFMVCEEEGNGCTVKRVVNCLPASRSVGELMRVVYERTSEPSQEQIDAVMGAEPSELLDGVICIFDFGPQVSIMMMNEVIANPGSHEMVASMPSRDGAPENDDFRSLIDDVSFSRDAFFHRNGGRLIILNFHGVVLM